MKQKLILEAKKACVLANKNSLMTTLFKYRRIKLEQKTFDTWIAVGDCLNELVLVSPLGLISQIHRQEIISIERISKTKLCKHNFRVTDFRLF